jgi:hypothetical protein
MHKLKILNFKEISYDVFYTCIWNQYSYIINDLIGR